MKYSAASERKLFPVPINGQAAFAPQCVPPRWGGPGFGSDIERSMGIFAMISLDFALKYVPI